MERLRPCCCIPRHHDYALSIIRAFPGALQALPRLPSPSPSSSLRHSVPLLCRQVHERQVLLLHSPHARFRAPHRQLPHRSAALPPPLLCRLRWLMPARPLHMHCRDSSAAGMAAWEARLPQLQTLRARLDGGVLWLQVSLVGSCRVGSRCRATASSSHLLPHALPPLPVPSCTAPPPSTPCRPSCWRSCMRCWTAASTRAACWTRCPPTRRASSC